MSIAINFMSFDYWKFLLSFQIAFQLGANLMDKLSVYLSGKNNFVSTSSLLIYILYLYSTSEPFS